MPSVSCNGVVSVTKPVCFPGVCFIVEEDIKEFTELKLDKRFYSILNILRHCQRVRELRSLGLIRYIVC